MAPRKTNTGKGKVGSDVVLPSVIPNKAKSATPASVQKKGEALRRVNKANPVNSIKEVRSETTTIGAIRKLVLDEGVTSTSVFYAASISNTPFKVTAYTSNTSEFSPEGTRLMQSIIASMDTLSDYTEKFADKPTIRQFIEQALLELQITSGLGCELVLNKERLPSHLQLVSYEDIEFKSNGKGGRYPVQKVRGQDDIDLNIPNFWVGELNKSPKESYASPILRPALNDSITNIEFIESMKRAVDKTGHSRLIVTLDSEKIKKSAPDEVQQDPEKLMTYMTSVQNAMATSLGELSPEDSIVVYDNTTATVEDIGGSKSDYVPLMKVLNNMQATSLKTPSSVLGLRSEGSQSLSNVEVMVYLKMLDCLRGPISDVLSRAFTLAARLYGADVYVKVKFDAIDLRPENELEAYRTMKNDRYLKYLSLGIWTQEQFCHESNIPYRQDMPDLSGTMFHIDTDKGEVDNTGGMERTLNPDTPKKGGGESQ